LPSQQAYSLSTLPPIEASHKQGDHPGDDYLFGRAFRIFLAALQFSITKLFHRLRIDIYPSQRNGKKFTAKEGLGSSSLINRGWLKTNQEIFR
jgi:hypothetical protein